MKLIPLSQESFKNHGKYFAMVDDSNFDYLNQFKWSACKNKNNYYATRNIKKQENSKRVIIYMHREIMKITNPLTIVDHRDMNGLNCQEDNLRIATASQNSANIKSRKNTSSKYLGVCRVSRRWSANIQKNKKQIYIGSFKSEEMAALAYNEMAKKLHGEFANLNIIML